MNRKEFKDQLKKTGIINYSIKFKRPDIKKPFTENYKFKMLKNGIIRSYLNDVKEVETTSLNHMYFIYRKALKFKSGRSGRRGNFNRSKKSLKFGDQDV